MSLLSWLYSDDDNAQRAAEANAKLEVLNAQRAGVLGPVWYAQVQQDYGSQVPFGAQAQADEIDSAFVEGWNDGKKNITGAVSGFFRIIGDGLGSVLFGIPFWIWLAAAGAVWVYLGAPGLRQLKGKFA